MIPINIVTLLLVEFWNFVNFLGRSKIKKMKVDNLISNARKTTPEIFGPKITIFSFEVKNSKLKHETERSILNENVQFRLFLIKISFCALCDWKWKFSWTFLNVNKSSLMKLNCTLVYFIREFKIKPAESARIYMKGG